ncbi:Gpr Fun34 family protein [Zymoseptoria brevis]|uniref:Gpr Fun34 family protein n=1 Tax=Zymoseptoria brevis TaxID=1047168 RepID=A0A0F4G4K4_9PEZI|nr:Gpr Fun34 family protein [Zymoseptoria brevis]
MSTIPQQYGENGAGNGTSAHDHVNGTNGASIRKPYDYGGNPLAHVNTGDSVRLAAFGGELQPGLYRSTEKRKFANPAPLGLCGFALTTFLLSAVNLGTRGLTEPNLVIGPAFAYGGLVQLLAGMWEMAVGNTFGATALSSYGGFWIGTAIILTPGGFNIIETLEADAPNPFLNSFGLYLMGWFIFTFLLLLLTVRSTVAFFILFLSLDLAFLMLGIAYLDFTAEGAPNPTILKAGGGFGMIAAFMAWYNAFAGMADSSNSFFLVPVAHFPWSEKGREKRGKVDNSDEREKQNV